jgi:hypothetical protein
MNKQAMAHFPALPKTAGARRSGHVVLGSPIVLLFIALTIYLMLSGTEPLLALACMLVLLAGAKLLWRVGEPPILFAAFALQWSQVSLLVIQAAVAGVPMTDYQYVPGIVMATWLSLGGLLVLAGGMWLMIRGTDVSDPLRQFQAEVRRYSPRRAFMAYLAAQVVVMNIDRAIGIVPGLTQILLSLIDFKWAFFFALAVIVMAQRRGYGFLATAFLFELVLGFTSYFADFKQVFYVMIVAALTVRPKMNVRVVLAFLPLAIACVVLLAAWSEVKMEYRRYLSGGTGQQTVVVGVTDQLGAIADLIWNKGLPNLGDGFDQMLKRTEYTQFFGAAVDHVPASVPYAGGAIWGAALVHIFEPRLLFPDKPSLEADIVNTEKYTGMRLTLEGRISDTEIPMGYMAESYVDFGPILMFVPIFLLGLLYGAEYRYLANLRYKLFAYGAMPVVFLSLSAYGLSAVKILGGNLTVFAAAYMVLRYFAPAVQRAILARRNLARI